MKDIPTEIAIALIGGLYAVLAGIWRTIARIEKNYVEHDTCEKRREKCPCVENIHEIKSELKELRK